MKISSTLIGLAAAVTLVASASTHAGFLLDNGTDGASDGWTVSGVSQPFGGFTQFTSFAIGDAAGWNISTVGIDGFASDPSGVGLTATLFPDSGGRPDEGNALASAVFFLTNDPFSGPAWRDEAYNVFLPQGTYWVRAEANGPDFSATWRDALMGGPAFSRRNSDGAEFAHGPLSLRINGVVPAPGALGLMLLGLGGPRRRR